MPAAGATQAHCAYTQRWIPFSLWLTQNATICYANPRSLGNVIQRPINHETDPAPVPGFAKNFFDLLGF